jgi:hypothetical protein
MLRKLAFLSLLAAGGLYIKTTSKTYSNTARLNNMVGMIQQINSGVLTGVPGGGITATNSGGTVTWS